MELRQLEYFAAVVRCGNFGRAAQDLYLTPSALSQQIGRLETELGLALFVRTPKGVQLTPAGVEFLDHARDILGRVAEARVTIDDHLDAVRGVARVAATTYDSQGLPEALVSFHREFPGIQLSLHHGSANQVMEELTAGLADVVVIGVTDTWPKFQGSVTSRIIYQEPLRLICAADHPVAGLRDASIDTLRGLPVIMPERGTALRVLLTDAFAKAGFSPLPFFETSDPATVRALARSGVGVGVVPASWLISEGHPPEVGISEFDSTVPEYRVALLARADGRLPARDLLAEHISRAFGTKRNDPLR